MHGNKTENTSFLDVCFALKDNVFRTMNVADLCVVRSIKDNIARCEYLTNGETTIETTMLMNLEINVNDVVLVVFTTNDFRASLKAYKTNQANTNNTTTTYHDKRYGVIVGVIFRKTEV